MVAMSDDAKELMVGLSEQYVNGGYPPHGAWSFSPTDSEQHAAFRELHARGLIKPAALGGHSWRLTDAGKTVILSAHPMSDGARSALQEIGEEYVKSGYPNYRTWSFSPGDPEQRKAFQELWSRGFIAPVALGMRDWRLTEGGKNAILSA